MDVDEAARSLAEKGFLVVEGCISGEEVTTAREALDHLYRADPGVAAHQKQPADALHVELLPNKGAIFERFFLNPVILPLVDHFLGADCVLQDVWSSGVPSGGAVFPLHSDEPVASCDRVLSVVTIYPLVPFTGEGGATRVVPGSHRAGRHPADEEPGAVPIEANPGSCIVLLGGVWHGRTANTTSATRSMMAAFFVRSWIRPNVDFFAALSPEVLGRAPERALQLYGKTARPPTTETWRWDFSEGRAKA